MRPQSWMRLFSMRVSYTLTSGAPDLHTAACQRRLRASTPVGDVVSYKVTVVAVYRGRGQHGARLTARTFRAIGAIQNQIVQGDIVPRFGDEDPSQERSPLTRRAPDDHTPPEGASAREGEDIVCFGIRPRAQATRLARLQRVDQPLGGAEGGGVGSLCAIRAADRCVLVASGHGAGIPGGASIVPFAGKSYDSYQRHKEANDNEYAYPPRYSWRDTLQEVNTNDDVFLQTTAFTRLIMQPSV